MHGRSFWTRLVILERSLRSDDVLEWENPDPFIQPSAFQDISSFEYLEVGEVKQLNFYAALDV
jgi:hypothetical protein